MTTSRATATTARRARGKTSEADNAPPRGVERPMARACACCGASLEGRRPQTRYCCPTCCSRAWDAAHGRAKHVNEGKRAARLFRGEAAERFP